VPAIHGEDFVGQAKGQGRAHAGRARLRELFGHHPTVEQMAGIEQPDGGHHRQRPAAGGEQGHQHELAGPCKNDG